MNSIEEEEVAVCLFWLYLQLSPKKSERNYWVHPINHKRTEEKTLKKFIAELRQDPVKFTNFTRLTPDTFDYVLNSIEDKIRKQDTNLRRSISPEERLIVTLRFLALGERFNSLHYYFRMGASTISKIVEETCGTIWEVLAPVHMKKPTSEDWLQVAEKFNTLWNFPNCLGAIDGKHIRIQCPHNSGSSYFNYKSFHSIVLQAVVDAEGKFLFVDIGDYGRNSDAGIFRHSDFGKLLLKHKLNIPRSRPLSSIENKDIPFVFIGDEAYPLLTNLLRPFPRRQLTNEKRIFNYRLSRARRLVECAFGIMSKRFQVLENVMLLDPEKATIVTLACCILHNVIRENAGSLTDIHDEIITQEFEHENARTCNPNRSNAGVDIRNEFLHYFNSFEGSVPWQNDFANII